MSLIRTGTLDESVEKYDKALKTYEVGQSFGERALLQNAPRWSDRSGPEPRTHETWIVW